MWKSQQKESLKERWRYEECAASGQPDPAVEELHPSVGGPALPG